MGCEEPECQKVCCETVSHRYGYINKIAQCQHQRTCLLKKEKLFGVSLLEKELQVTSDFRTLKLISSKTIPTQSAKLTQQVVFIYLWNHIIVYFCVWVWCAICVYIFFIYFVFYCLFVCFKRERERERTDGLMGWEEVLIGAGSRNMIKIFCGKFLFKFFIFWVSK